MYDDLVRCLRGHSQKMGCTDNCICYDAYKRGFATCSEELAKLAADAIEELQAAKCPHYIRNVHDRGDDSLCDKFVCEVKSLPKWIPVTERKPKTDEFVIVAIHDDSGDTPYDVTNVGFYLDVFPLGVWIVESDRCNYVTHWMPLPQPPKEE